jgi:predicted RNase H-like HicB family nuclease
MATASRNMSDVTLERDGDIIVATHTDSGVASQGDTEAEALQNLAEALRLHDELIPADADLDDPEAPWF